MKRSEYIVHALRMELSRGGAMVITANQSGSGNKQSFKSTSLAPSEESAGKPKGKRGKKQTKK